MSWSPPSLLNGFIQEYRVNVTEVETGIVFIVMPTTTSVTVLALHPYYNYTCYVSAYTVEVGPYAVVDVTTLEDGEILCNDFGTPA